MKDNLNVNSIGDYIVEDTNVSELLRINKVKIQRNKEAREKRKYQTIAELIFIVLIVGVLVLLLYKLNKFDKEELAKCMVNHTEYHCKKGM